MGYNKSPIKIVLIIAIALVLIAGVLIYFVGRPMFNEYVEQKQIEVKDYVLSYLIENVKANGYVEITDIEGNKLVLVPYKQNVQS